MYRIWYIGKGVDLKRIKVGTQAQKVINTFSAEVTEKFWLLMWDVQQGHSLTLPLSRPMSIVAHGVHELRLKDRYGIYRIFYYLKLQDRILVFHAFHKKTQRTPHEEIETAQARLKNLLEEL
jgi:phage-related protein